MRIKYDARRGCTGCKLCAVVCAWVNERAFNPRYARIRVLKEYPALDKPAVCLQCPEPGCVAACARGALAKNHKNVVQVIPELCDGCGECVDACAGGAIALHPETGLAIKCELCEQRLCVEFCPTRALVFVRHGGGAR